MSWPRTPCEACPRVKAGLPGECLCQTHELHHICGQQARGDGRYTGLILGKVEMVKSRPPPAETAAPEPPPSEPGKVALRASLTSWTGYGQTAGWIGRGLDRAGVLAGFLEAQPDPRYLPVDPWVAARKAPTPPLGSWVLQVSVPFIKPLDGRRTAAYSMWESSRVGPLAVACLNKARVVVVPCRHNSEAFASSGVTTPIRVVPMGIDPAEGYAPKPFPEGKPYTFGMAGRMAHGGIRKGLNEGMAAFVKAFDKGEDVMLNVKVYEDCLPALRVPPDPRILIQTRAMTTPEMAAWYGGIDCLFVPSKGEGWGLHTHQAMACGRPVIAARYSGTAEFFDSRFGWELPYRLEPAGEFYVGQGDWCVPSEEGMVDALRTAYRSQDDGREKGALAARRALEFTWQRTGREVVAVLREFGVVPVKPRGSLADAVQARRDCVPCRERGNTRRASV